jgi:hypothetical protein
MEVIFSKGKIPIRPGFQRWSSFPEILVSWMDKTPWVRGSSIQSKDPRQAKGKNQKMALKLLIFPKVSRH